MPSGPVFAMPRKRQGVCAKLIERIEERLAPMMAALSPIRGLPDMFARCFLSTLESTCQEQEDGGVFIITGDIEAMWLRDSTEQTLHYLRFARQETALADWVERVIARQVDCVLLDPYANAFNISPNGRHGYSDPPCPHEGVWERKYELYSLCHVLLLAWRYQQATDRNGFLDERFFRAMAHAVDVMETEQRHEACSDYRFQRFGCPPSDTLSREGRGEPVGDTGMSWSGFRPSDDACRYGYLVPANLFAAAMLQKLSAMANAHGQEALAMRAARLSGEISAGVARHGVVETERFGAIYAYEVDGLGHALLMDDANIPSLLSLPYLGVCQPNDPLYLRTRTFVLSEHNPQFFSGRAACGVGSPHTPPRAVWPIGLCIQGLTACHSAERASMLRMLLTTHAGTARMHESFDCDRPSAYTRGWFAWANSMFGELVCRMYELGELEDAVAWLLKNDIKDINKASILT